MYSSRPQVHEQTRSGSSLSVSGEYGNVCRTSRHGNVIPSASAPCCASRVGRFMDRRGGCFAPQSPVEMFDGSSCEIQFLRRGMRVCGGACVQHVLRIIYNAVVPMVSLEAAAGTCACVLSPMPSPPHVLSDSVPVLVTPWHPVLFAGEWRFPCSICSPSPFYMDCVYSVVLSAGHVTLAA